MYVLYMYMYIIKMRKSNYTILGEEIAKGIYMP